MPLPFKTVFRTCVLGAVVFALAGCDLTEEPFAQQVVVEAVLVAGEAIPEIRLTRTASVEESYDLFALAVPGAEVRVIERGPGGEAAEIRFAEDPVLPGFYYPEPGTRVRPGFRYRLEARVPDALGLTPPGALVSAETVVPDTFRIVQPPPDTVRYNPIGPSPALRMTRSVHPERQAIYVFSIVALEPDAFDLTPTYASFVDPADRLNFVEGSSGLINEGTYDLNPDGTLTLSIPWLSVAFYGPTQFIASAVDDALYDFFRSRDTQFGSATLSPGEIPELLSNVQNGAGVFGSVAQQRVEVFIAPR